jgi:hypothetical protein
LFCNLLKASGDIGKIPKNVIDILRDQVFGFDTFFVTSQEAYEVRSMDLCFDKLIDPFVENHYCGN